MYIYVYIYICIYIVYIHLQICIFKISDYILANIFLCNERKRN